MAQSRRDVASYFAAHGTINLAALLSGGGAGRANKNKATKAAAAIGEGSGGSGAAGNVISDDLAAELRQRYARDRDALSSTEFAALACHAVVSSHRAAAEAARGERAAAAAALEEGRVEWERRGRSLELELRRASQRAEEAEARAVEAEEDRWVALIILILILLSLFLLLSFLLSSTLCFMFHFRLFSSLLFSSLSPRPLSRLIIYLIYLSIYLSI